MRMMMRRRRKKEEEDFKYKFLDKNVRSFVILTSYILI